MKKNLGLILTRMNLKKIELSDKEKSVYSKWKAKNDGTEKDFYKSLLKISISHENQYKAREKCGKKGHNEDILGVDMNHIYTKCKTCGTYFDRSVNDERFLENQYSFADI